MKDKEPLFLVVDDEPGVSWAFENLLKRKGYRSKQALSGQEALALIEQYVFSVALLDAKLPDIDGLELAKRIKAVNPATYIVIVSGYFSADDTLMKEALREQVISFVITKPFLHSEILRIIEQAQTSG
jgi:DNA-binding NtrC family response regulator